MKLNGFLILSFLCLVGCAYPRERTYVVEGSAEEISTLPYKEESSLGVLNQRVGNDTKITQVYTVYNRPEISRGGLTYCSNSGRCPREARLPYQPCLKKMPKYYNNVSAEEIAKGILLQHPITRTEVLCFDSESASAVSCAEDFMASGYILITDIPQVSANYDMLRTNTYPTRRWRNGGEYIPRW